MWSDESTFWLVGGASKVLRRPINVNRYNPHFVVRTVKHPGSVMVWGCSSGERGRRCLYLLPKITTTKGANYIKVLRKRKLSFQDIHGCDFYAWWSPAHRSWAVKTFLNDQNIEVLDWPGNSPDLNPIENAWNKIKNDQAKLRALSPWRKHQWRCWWPWTSHIWKT